MIIERTRGGAVRKYAALIVMFVVSVFGSTPAMATAHGLQYCREIDQMTMDMAQFAGAIALLGDHLDYITVVPDEEAEMNFIKSCAKEIRTRICSDDYMMGLLDPLPNPKALVGGWAIGKMLDSPALGAFAGDIYGRVEGVLDAQKCMHDLQEEHIPLFQKIGPVRIAVRNVSLSFFDRIVDVAAANGRMTGADAQNIKRIAAEIAHRAVDPVAPTWWNRMTRP